MEGVTHSTEGCWLAKVRLAAMLSLITAFVILVWHFDKALRSGIMLAAKGRASEVAQLIFVPNITHDIYEWRSRLFKFQRIVQVDIAPNIQSCGTHGETTFNAHSNNHFGFWPEVTRNYSIIWPDCGKFIFNEKFGMRVFDDRIAGPNVGHIEMPFYLGFVLKRNENTPDYQSRALRSEKLPIHDSSLLVGSISLTPHISQRFFKDDEGSHANNGQRHLNPETGRIQVVHSLLRLALGVSCFFLGLRLCGDDFTLRSSVGAGLLFISLMTLFVVPW